MTSKADPRPSPESRTEKLHKILARSGIASRRKCEDLIATGRVTVDGRVERNVATRVHPDRSNIRVDGEPIRREKPLYFAFFKPRGVLCTAAENEPRPRVIDFFRGYSARLFPVGRLDEDSEGLLLVTNDGSFAQVVAHPRHGTLKTYDVVVLGRLSQADLERIRRGVWLSEGKTRVEQVRIHRTTPRSTVVRLTLGEGRNREIRRIFARFGHRVRRLCRVAIGPVTLERLRPGRFRPLQDAEMRALTEERAGPTSDHAASGRRGGRPRRARAGARGRNKGPRSRKERGPS